MASRHTVSGSNGSKFPVRFRVGFRPGPGPLQPVSTKNPGISSLHFWLQISVWVLIVTWHDHNVDCAVSAPLSPPALIFAIGSVLVASLLTTRTFRLKYHLLSQRCNQYCSNRKSDSERWKRGWYCAIYVLIMSRYDQHSDTQLQPKLKQP
jgi:hypothetical protein